MPCQFDGQCATGVCEVVPGTANVTSCRMLNFAGVVSLTSEMIMDATIRVCSFVSANNLPILTPLQCIEIAVDPFSLLFVKQSLGLNCTLYEV